MFKSYDENKLNYQEHINILNSGYYLHLLCFIYNNGKNYIFKNFFNFIKLYYKKNYLVCKNNLFMKKDFTNVPQ